MGKFTLTVFICFPVLISKSGVSAVLECSAEDITDVAFDGEWILMGYPLQQLEQADKESDRVQFQEHIYGFFLTG